MYTNWPEIQEKYVKLLWAEEPGELQSLGSQSLTRLTEKVLGLLI